MLRYLCGLTVAVLVACRSSNDGAVLGQRAKIVALMFSDSMTKLETAVSSGTPCTTLVSVPGNPPGRTPKTRQTLVDQMDIVTVGFEIHKTSASAEYDALANRFNAWDTKYKDAVEACNKCVADMTAVEPSTTEEFYKQTDRLSSCKVP